MSSDSKTAFSCRKNTYIMIGIISELNYCREKKSVNLSTFRSTEKNDKILIIYSGFLNLHGHFCST